MSSVRKQGTLSSAWSLSAFLEVLKDVLIFLQSAKCCCRTRGHADHSQRDTLKRESSKAGHLPSLGQELHIQSYSLFLLGRDSADCDQRKREEDFYYTEVQVKEEPAAEATTNTSPTSVSAPIIIQQALAKPEALLVEPPMLEPALASSSLSQSAPSSFWHIQADHAYQVSWCHLLLP